MNGKKYLTLCSKSFSGELNEEEEKILTDWLAESDQNRMEYDSVKNLWDKTAINSSIPYADIEQDWEMLNKRINNEVLKSDQNGLFKYLSDGLTYLFAPRLRPIFASAILLFGIMISWMIFSRSELKPQLISIQTSGQEHKSVTLSDGSLVTLNKSSKLEYLNRFDEKRREVYLFGEAYFSVKKDGRPFVIKTSNATTTVLGTKFNVWARDEMTKVYVTEGKVKVADETNSNPVYLTRNQLSAVKEKMKPSNPVDVDSDFLSEWLNNKLVFSNSTLNEVIEELQGYYSTKIRVDGTNLSKYNLTGSFKNNDVDSVLTMICLALDISYTKTSDGYLIKLRN